MTKMKKKVLIVDDEKGVRESLKMILSCEYETLIACDAHEALSIISHQSIDLILLDICMPGLSGLELLEELNSKKIKISVIMVTATKTIKTAVSAMKLGAKDYITKPFDVEEILLTVKDHIHTNQNNQHHLKTFKTESIIGYDTTLKKVFKLIDKLAHTDSTVLILGESGTGKELIAKAVHYHSIRKEHSFVPVHLSSLSENLLESEIFGHIKGSFTGALKDKKGAFEVANNGTLFLDEIGEISESIQIKLLRVIQEKEFKAVGDHNTRKTNARLIAATNKNLYQLVKDNKFRADLYYRLNVVPIELPPLRERIQDIPILVKHLSNKICSRFQQKTPEFDDNVMNAFKIYDWPGNIRELENTLENILLLTDNDIINNEDLPPHIAKNHDLDQSLEQSSEVNPNVLSNIEKETIQLALLRNNGVLTSTAKYLGTTRRILKYKMDKLGIDKSIIFNN